MIRTAFAALAFSLMAPVAQATPVQDLMRALGMTEMVSIMRSEGLAYGQELGADMLGGAGATWDASVRDVYDAERMEATLEAHFSGAMAPDQIAPLVTFFTTDTGRRIVELEVSARRAISDPSVEEAARDAYRGLADKPDARFETITDYIEINDLVEYNVVSALNSNIAFYRGLVDEGALKMADEDIMAEAWGQEEETRADTKEWLYAFLLMAYGPLSDADLDSYVDLSRSKEGRALNAALFAGFNAMYDEISYGLGRAVAREMASQDI